MLFSGPLFRCVCLDSLFQIFRSEIQAMHIDGENCWIIVGESAWLARPRPLRRAGSAEELGALRDQVTVNGKALSVWLVADVNNKS